MDSVYSSSSSGIVRATSRFSRVVIEVFFPLLFGWGVSLAVMPPCVESGPNVEVTCAAH